MAGMISIDFGNSYTKVAIRPDSRSAAALMKDDSLSLDELNICVPTLAACSRRGKKETWSFGTDVMQHRAGAAGLEVFRNWKPTFFRGEETHLERPAAAVLAVHGPATIGRPASGRLTDDAWQQVKSTFGFDDSFRDSFEANMRPKEVIRAAPAPPEDVTELDIKQIGLGFFTWLRETLVEPACRKSGLGPFDTIPVRISLPSFGGATRAELLLREILEEAGWRPDDRAPVLAEPLANSIGAFTEGRNALRESETGHWPNYGVMFRNTGLLGAIREAVLHDGPKVAWAMIVDLGGYTADFAMIGLPLDDIESRIEGEVDGKRRAARYSEPIGITDLDDRIRELLGDRGRSVLEMMARDPDQRRLETFHRSVYGKYRVYSAGNRVTIGAGDEMGQIRECVQKFAEDVAEYAERFLEINQYDHIDDLILTGGGSMLPAVRHALRDRLTPYGVRQTHLYLDPGEPAGRGLHQLPQQLVRGATALGGASVYFDFAG